MKKSAVPGRSAADPYGTIPSPVAEPETPELAETVSIPGGLPKVIDRYRIESVLGKGGFGLVYLAHDDQLQRLVAIKVPHRKLVDCPEDAEAYLTEARTVASLDHPHIVPVFDVGGTEQFPCFVVSKYIDGTDLATRLKQSRLSIKETTELIATIAEALHYAHRKGLVHRDIKPANILIDTDNKPYVADFGLALKEEDFGRGASFAGTPAYMSPEQARGEGHRVDGRSDIFSLGVVLYELLTGRRPFKADSQAELLDQISSVEARPPRQVDDVIPRELERICLKTLSKRASERYTTAKDLADDLRHFFAQATDAEKSTLSVKPASDTAAVPTPVPTGTEVAPSDSRPIKIVPKGLRSFDAHDADFFLELLPGPRDRDGLPDSLRFWKTRIEEKDADNTFSVGLIYGPSGCGKSSLVKAGLLPRLSDDVVAVYVEATAEETETRLLNGLRKRCPNLPDNLSLKETLAALRRGQGIPAGKKVLIVLDQFEQWLHAKKEEQNTELVQALRQCDGQHVQCIVMVRDDFWLAVSRFLRELEIRLVEGQNSALADLFDVDHARKVLAAFGRAFGKLSESSGDTSNDQKEFLIQAVSGLAQEGKVISVRLALFAEMMKGKSWTPATLKEVGGTEGVGVTFLEETFSAATAPPEHRYHQKAARGVLKALLPESGTDIKGHMRSHSELLNASGYGNRPKDFDDLIRILDSEIRLITPTDPEGKEGAEETTSPAQSGQKYYQLTHDYLVPSLRDWLTRKQKETRKGRAELLLADRAAVWSARPENRQLPSLLQWLSIRWFTPKKDWTQPQRMMMSKAGWYHASRGTILVVLLAVVTVTGLAIRDRVVDQRKATQAEGMVQRLLDAETDALPFVLHDMEAYRQWTEPLLRGKLLAPDLTPRGKLHASIALLPNDPSQVEYLYGQIFISQPKELSKILHALEGHKDKLIDRLWSDLLNDPQDKATDERIPSTASALARYAPDDPRWNKAAAKVAENLVGWDWLLLIGWMKELEPVRAKLIPPLVRLYRGQGANGFDTERVTSILLEYAYDYPDVLADMLMDADKRQFVSVFQSLHSHGERGVALLLAEINKQIPADSKEDEKEKVAKRQANAAVALVRLGAAEQAWPLLKHTPDPRVRSYFIHLLGPLGGDPQAIIKRLETEPEVSIRRALLLALGEFNETQLPLAERQPLAVKLLALYETEPDAGMHTSAEWLLRTWGGGKKLQAVVEKLRADQKQRSGPQAGEKRNWYVNSQGQTMVIIEAGEFQMGSPTTESGRFDNETQHRRKIGRRFAMASHEVTKAQFGAFQAERPEIDKVNTAPYLNTADSPQTAITWYEAVAYCNWLSAKEGLTEDQWCYEPNAEKKYAAGMKAKPKAGELLGYRLPSEAEWEFACRAGAITSRYYGLSEPLLAEYAWYQANGQTRSWPVKSLKPNDWGLFDMLGNAYEWTNNPSGVYPDSSPQTLGPAVDLLDEKLVANNQNRVLRGGGFLNQASDLRSAYRGDTVPSNRDDDVGFRLARTLPLVPITPLPPPAEGGR